MPPESMKPGGKPSEPPQPGPLTGRRALLVDDDPTLGRALARLLRSAGAECVVAGQLAEAEEALARGAFDVVLTDLQLPDGDGLGLARRAAEPTDGRQGAVVVAMTGHADAALAQHAKSMGACALLEKPFEPARLVALLGELLAARAAPT